ncbi:MAG: hypothetical protein CMJ64_12290 [Planctomycetaceae bacterium]|nr:hypothetical protein [Planctomycetaceae bacterium]
MNDHEWNNNTQLDRLVDGELSSEEYREFLQTLECEPHGWRRCAMAFLETQAFGQEFSALTHETGVAPHEHETSVVHDSRRGQGIARLALAMAASFLVAFGLGAWWRSGAARFDTSPAAVADKDTQKSGVGTELAQQSPPVGIDPPRQDYDQEQLTFVVDRGDGQSERFEMPVFREEDAYARWLVEQSPLPADVERDLRRAGYQIERQRQWAPVRLRDGRRAVFPVDELQITPVSNRSY